MQEREESDRLYSCRAYELAGPRVYTLRNLFTIALRILRERRLLVSIPFAVAACQQNPSRAI